LAEAVYGRLAQAGGTVLASKKDQPFYSISLFGGEKDKRNANSFSMSAFFIAGQRK
jgi:hypothetical protein